MSLHRSLVSKNALVRRRNVLTRGERVAKLSEEGKLKADDTVFGLPKVKVRRIRKRVKMQKKKTEAAVAEQEPQTKKP